MGGLDCPRICVPGAGLNSPGAPLTSDITSMAAEARAVASMPEATLSSPRAVVAIRFRSVLERQLGQGMRRQWQVRIKSGESIISLLIDRRSRSCQSRWKGTGLRA